ncbi:MAG: hypothetical protein FVQ82_02375 [Planctomycetes bacterium]|nr:hypothetical protein [Planctomycetota bacterium]
MTIKRTLKLIHLTGTLFFLASIAFILVLALRQRDVSWWIIFSLSGHTALMGLLLISVYLFAMFRGVSGSPEVNEHPLTSSAYYMLFYVCSPYLGLAAGIIAMYDEPSARSFLLGVSLGTFCATFVGWVIVDPLVGLIESVLPASRRHKAVRLEAAHKEKEKNEAAKKLLIEQVLKAEDISRNEWKEELSVHAEKLASLVICGSDVDDAEAVAASIGVKAWRMGGLTCMKFLHEMTMDACRVRGDKDGVEFVDRVSVWWDGIGRWQNTSIV